MSTEFPQVQQFLPLWGIKELTISVRGSALLYTLWSMCTEEINYVLVAAKWRLEIYDLNHGILLLLAY